ncbi:MAG: cation transporter [Phycisphaerae bacterium]|nr:cation transporter [Phycisphaerae bacterium]
MHTTFTVTGMRCAECARALTRVLGIVPGVRSAQVTVTPPEAHIESDAPIPLPTLEQAARSAGAYTLTPHAASSSIALPTPQPPPTPTTGPTPSLFPLLLIVSFIAGTCALTTQFRGVWSWHTLMLDFMAGFFLVFSFFKLLDLRAFADAYQVYDLLARRSRAYALAYPFLELALGVAYLIRWQPMLVNAAALALMLIGSLGVLRALLDKRAIRCACLGAALNLPMTTVTLIEDLGMAAMAAAALLWPH